MKRRIPILVGCAIVILVVSVASGYYWIASNNASGPDIFFFVSCSVSGAGKFELRIVSDSTGAVVNADRILAVDRLGCNFENQVIHLTQFSHLQAGWLMPVFPSQAVPAGELDFTVVYGGRTYSFSSSIPPVGTARLTLHVPSGNETTTLVTNGNGSYCYQVVSR